MKDGRNIVFDALKALAIFLVVYGHSIQFFGVTDYWTNPVFQFIYSFHMPLFFMISGFFFSSALRLGWKDFLIKKSVTLLLPCYVWAFIYGGIHFTGWGEFGQKLINPWEWPFWFLKGLFLTQLIVYTCMHLSSRIMGRDKKHLLFAMLMTLAVYVLPFMSVPRVMTPMFWMGYVIRLYYDQFKTHYLSVGMLSLLIFSILYLFWDTEGMQYYAGALPKAYEIIGHMREYTWHDGLLIVHRIAIGLSGSVAIIALMHVTQKIPDVVAIVGSATQGIYILQTLVLETILGTYVSFVGMNCFLVVALILPVCALMIVVGCAYLSKLIQTDKVLGRFLLGKW